LCPTRRCSFPKDPILIVRVEVHLNSVRTFSVAKMEAFKSNGQRHYSIIPLMSAVPRM
jgi:hypothetical protein